MRKICKKCGEEKAVEEFSKDKNSKDLLSSQCKDCIKEYKKVNKEYLKQKSKEYIEKNKKIIKEKKKHYSETHKELIKERRKIYYNLNKEKCKEKSKKYKEENYDKILQNYNKNKEYYKIKNKEWREENKEKSSKSFKEFYKNNKEYFKIKKKEYSQSEKGKQSKREWCNEYNSKNKHVVLWRSLLRRTIVQLKQEKFDTTLNSLGYSAIELKEHIEKNWSEGMNWENYGDWHVDHIRSVGTFESADLPSVVNALSNLKPMWSTNRIIDGVLYEGNLNKGKKMN